MDFISVFDEASRDIEAEAVERRHTAALQDATAATWQFLALAKSEPEFGHRLALVEDRLEALASQHGVSYEEITAPLRQGFQALLESREAAGRGPKVAAEHSAGYGLKATDVVGYTADADMHCVDCAHRIYGDDKGGSEPKQDGEGNQVHPIFASDEGWDDEHCGTCGKPLSEGRRIYSSLQAQAGTKCAECGHSSDEHVRGAVCPTCGCTSFTARTASKTAAEQCDSTHPEGHRCILPKGHMEDTSTHEEFTGYDGSTVRGGWHDGGEGTDYWRYHDEDPDNPKYKGTAYRKTAAEIMAPGSVRVTHRPDKSGRFDVVQVWGPTSSQTIHQGYDSVEAHQVAQEAVDQARAGEGPNAVLYPSAPGHDNLDDKDRGPREYREASFDRHIARIRQALMEGQDPLAWVPQSAPTPAAAEKPDEHDEVEEFAGEPGAVIDKVTSRGDAPFPGPR